MNVNSRIICNLQAPAYTTIYAPQGDALSRFVTIQLLDGSSPWTVPDGALVTIRAAKPDGTFCYYDTNESGDSAYTISGSTVTIELVAQVLAVAGSVLIQVNFYNASGTVLSTFAFCLQVTESVLTDGEIESSDYFSVLTATLAQTAQYAQEVKAAYGAPLVASTAAGMTDHTRVYVYTGSETGYTNGNWYYWDGSAWASGGVYNSTAVSVDTTLSIAGKPADAAKTGALAAPVFSSSTAYSAGQHVLYNGQLYVFTASHAAGAWSGTDASEVNLGGEVSGLKSNVGTLSNLNTDDKSSIVAAVNEVNGRFLDGLSEAVAEWLDDHPEATTTVQDGSLTHEKFTTKLGGELRTLSSFSGSTDGERLYDALITQSFSGTILGGNITINETITIPRVAIRDVKIANSVITLNADMFATADTYVRLPSFVNCTFIGNGNAIFASGYAVYGSFIGCSFIDCALIDDASTGTVQSAFVAYSDVKNTTVPFIRANNLYDVRIIGVDAEAQAAKFIDTSASTGTTGGPRTLWVSNSTFEGFSSTVFDLAGGGPCVSIKDCYFEANTGGCLTLAKSNDGYDYLTLEIAGCKVNSSVTPFVISGFTNNYRVKVSIHDNTYYTSVSATPMVTGIPVDTAFTVYNNRPSAQTDIFSDAARFVYEPQKSVYPTYNSTYIALSAGGYIQIGALVFFDVAFKAKQTTGGNVSSIMTSLPKPAVGSVRFPVMLASDSSETQKTFYITTGGTATLYGGITLDEKYSVRGFYFTSNKVTQ